MAIKTGLTVIKSDRQEEPYLHTKVLGAISHALSDTGNPDVASAEDLADVVTFYLYEQNGSKTVDTNEIHSIIKAVLSTTGYEDAAEALTEFHLRRKLKRRRVSVVKMDLDEFLKSGDFDSELYHRVRWEKSAIVHDLVSDFNLNRRTARHISGLVEAKIFKMDISDVPASLIRQVMLSETARVLKSQRQMKQSNQPAGL